MLLASSEKTLSCSTSFWVQERLRVPSAPSSHGSSTSLRPLTPPWSLIADTNVFRPLRVTPNAVGPSAPPMAVTLPILMLSAVTPTSLAKFAWPPGPFVPPVVVPPVVLPPPPPPVTAWVAPVVVACVAPVPPVAACSVPVPADKPPVEAMHKMGKPEQALAFCKRAAALEPNSADPYAKSLVYLAKAERVDTDAVQWAAGNLLRRDWSADRLAPVTLLPGDPRLPVAGSVTVRACGGPTAGASPGSGGPSPSRQWATR